MSIRDEWQWAVACDPFIKRQHAIYTHLMWRGIVLGSVEAFSDNGPYYGNLGDGLMIDARYRTGAMTNIKACRERVEEIVYTVIYEACLP